MLELDRDLHRSNLKYAVSQWIPQLLVNRYVYK